MFRTVNPNNWKSKLNKTQKATGNPSAGGVIHD